MKRLISIGVSLIILAIIYSKIDFPKLIEVFKDCDRLWMVISLGMVIPLTLITSWRLQQLMPSGSRLGFFEANRLILAASVLNMVLPSKMGDIAKAYFMKQRGHLAGSLSLSLVIFEKACDMLSLLLWCAFGLLLYEQKDWLFWIMTTAVGIGLVMGIFLLASRKFAYFFFLVGKRFAPKKIRSKLVKMQESWGEMHDYFWRDKNQLLKITSTSIFIWFLHLLQIWFFILALNAWTPFVANLALSPLAILAGLLPLTFAGVGTRDAALVIFYQPYFDAATAAALGLLCTSRYLLPAIGGLPFLGQFLSTVRMMKLEREE
ncbi:MULTISPECIES: lysylphosphatidylglycerol synthase transmembrane domain-containing protein [unclassified Coleofasciculus]|uniref:lysylphosphatidylglycerol synthase transmembrane domain-containing protein n=1 Tax=unclassified Coleofasciculus TaxID=2692782 RepID=UPI00188055CA|nr:MULTISPECIES: lysylphosphatidylglycerol synthase transmembrane domain-containing protein [unclassified Coleofasciculus]MBE9125829.1 flippase-like domain-containing protein [Coleofasciculus sp. LEGE 07081]MBE9148986.1 flippase-like domain-containing protein [Coleofasciculus sp. LEGE 07092]